jgi:hypothetical protein
MYNKKAQIGDTTTWIFATIIIIVIIFISIFIVSFYQGKNKEIEELKNVDVVAAKSLFSYVLTKNQSEQTVERVYHSLRKKGDFDNYTGILAQKIFKEYERNYKDLWVGFEETGSFFPFKKNDFFGGKPSGIKGGDFHIGSRTVEYYQEDIFLDENKSLIIYLSKEKSIKQ